MKAENANDIGNVQQLKRLKHTCSTALHLEQDKHPTCSMALCLYRYQKYTSLLSHILPLENIKKQILNIDSQKEKMHH